MQKIVINNRLKIYVYIICLIRRKHSSPLYNVYIISFSIQFTELVSRYKTLRFLVLLQQWLLIQQHRKISQMCKKILKLRLLCTHKRKRKKKLSNSAHIIYKTRFKQICLLEKLRFSTIWISNNTNIDAPRILIPSWVNL